MSKQFYIRLQHGISGGFMPPNPTSVQEVTSSLSNGVPSVLLKTTKRAHNERKLPTEPTSQSVLPSSSTTKIDTLVAELEGILKNLPREDPPGSKDIYGLDVGLMFGSDQVEWMNGGPQGCGEGVSSTEASDEQKKEFTRAIEIVEELANLGQVDTASK